MSLNCTYTLTTNDDGARVARLDGDLEISLAASPDPDRPFTEEEVAILDDGLTQAVTTIIGQLGYTITSDPLTPEPFSPGLLTPGPVTLDQLITVTINRKDLTE